MSKLDQAVGRLAAALEQLEQAVGDGATVAGGASDAETRDRIAALETERNRLAAEIERLERQVEERAVDRLVAATAEALAPLGADFLGINPVHARGAAQSGITR